MDPRAFRERCLKRSPVYGTIALWIQDRIPRVAGTTAFRSDAPMLLSHAYFLLSDSYKDKRRQHSRTDDDKKAALSALSVMALRPFEPLDPHDVELDATYFVNPIYAIACANAWISDRNLLDHYPRDYLRRFYLSLLRVRFPSLETFLHAVNDGDHHADICSIDLSWQEVDEIEDWIHKFWLLANRKI